MDLEEESRQHIHAEAPDADTPPGAARDAQRRWPRRLVVPVVALLTVGVVLGSVGLATWLRGHGGPDDRPMSARPVTLTALGGHEWALVSLTKGDGPVLTAPRTADLSIAPNGWTSASDGYHGLSGIMSIEADTVRLATAGVTANGYRVDDSASRLSIDSYGALFSGSPAHAALSTNQDQLTLTLPDGTSMTFRSTGRVVQNPTVHTTDTSSTSAPSPAIVLSGTVDQIGGPLREGRQPQPHPIVAVVDIYRQRPGADARTSTPMSEMTTAEDGTFETMVTPGSYLVVATTRTGLSTSKTVKIQPDAGSFSLDLSFVVP